VSDLLALARIGITVGMRGALTQPRIADAIRQQVKEIVMRNVIPSLMLIALGILQIAIVVVELSPHV
jgi:hypothetical protein